MWIPEFDIKPEEGQRTHQPKHCEYNTKDEVNSLNILSSNFSILYIYVLFLQIHLGQLSYKNIKKQY